jgi:hypothetical protein
MQKVEPADLLSSEVVFSGILNFDTVATAWRKEKGAPPARRRVE